jgi:type IX secretion system PorP/SprF family membrane protein
MIRSVLVGLMLIGVFMVGGNLSAQDVHFSQYNSSPLLLNPAFSGLDNGDYRVYANYRMQWPTISSAGYTYRTFAAGADMALGKITKYNSYAGIGLSFFSDQAGAIDLSTNRVTLSLAYHFMLNHRGTMQLSAGLQGSFNYRSIDPSKATYDDQWDPTTGTVNPGIAGETFGRTKVIYGDAGLGLIYSAMIKESTNIHFGFSLDHVNQPNISFYPSNQEISGNGGQKLYMKETFHGGLAIPVGTRISVLPNFLVLLQGPSHEFDLGCDVKTALGNDARTSTTAIHFGAQFRGPLDAVIVNTRIDIKGFSCGLSYDINVSKLLPASHTVGAPEIALIYQGSTRKKPLPGHCPVMF